MKRILNNVRTPIRNTIAAVSIGAVVAFGAPMKEGIVRPAYAQTAQAYDTQANPFEINDRMRSLVQKINNGTDRQKIKRLWEALNTAADEGVKVIDMDKTPPRTAVEALSNGGDCNEFANIVVAMLKEMDIPGGVLLIHSQKAAADEMHIVPFAQIGKKKVLIDLQAQFGKTAKKPYKVITTYDYDESAAMYHREWGEYFKANGMTEEAAAAYERSLEIYEQDAFVHYNLGILHERSRNLEKAAEHLSRAAELDPKKYGKEKRRAMHNLKAQTEQQEEHIYNEESKKGQKAMGEGRWEECIEHFQNALDAAGHRLSKKGKEALIYNIDACKSRLEE